ncbi:probable protein phosphatase 2C 71 [Selaginella moellendorffii]|uniref:probable protein phosphatase 2C 71 n=1 Tax=Selaginella moellendorffii TaxID=88036 RepID=UPI000D1C411F|nr:probable protein phosphatase 2C 71 [Selaginella moellendorffii]|eukprot:XP_024520774.1 probable protein phosphatase 2C 71 [Selaginella moellendorffii]
MGISTKELGGAISHVDVLRCCLVPGALPLLLVEPAKSVAMLKTFNCPASLTGLIAPEETTHVTFDESAVSLPQPAKTHNSACKNGEEAQRGGEDAFVTEGSWMGVADGVGGWAGEGIDSGMYSRELMGHCKALVVNSKGKPDPKDVLVKAAGSTKAQGSATVLVAALFEQTCTQQTWETWVHHSSQLASSCKLGAHAA